MADPFVITAATTEVQIDPNNQGRIRLAIKNVSGHPIQPERKLTVISSDQRPRDWFSMEPQRSRALADGETLLLDIRLRVPHSVSVGEPISCIVTMNDAYSPDEVFITSPELTFWPAPVTAMPQTAAAALNNPVYVVALIGMITAILVGIFGLTLSGDSDMGDTTSVTGPTAAASNATEASAVTETALSQPTQPGTATIATESPTAKPSTSSPTPPLIIALTDQPDIPTELALDDPTTTRTASPQMTVTPTEEASGGEPTVPRTSTPSSTAPPTRTADVSPTPARVAEVPLRVQSVSGSEIGNGHLRVFHFDQLGARETMRIELELRFDNYYITPTPFGPRTVIPADTGTPEPASQSTARPSPTPREPRFEAPSASVDFYPLMGASLICAESRFEGCDAQNDPPELRPIGFDGETWTWIITPRDEISGSQDLRLELWRLIRINDGPEQVQVVWDHNFQINIQSGGDDLTTVLLIAIGGGIIIVLIATGVVTSGVLKRYKTEEFDTPMVPLNGPKVFISYRRSVSAGYGRTLHDRLTARGAEVFIDIEDIHAGEFSEYIRQSIANCDYFIVLLAPGTLDSEWVVKEINYGHSLGKTIIPVLVNNFDLYGGSVPDTLDYLRSQQAVQLLPQYLDGAISIICKYIGLGE